MMEERLRFREDAPAGVLELSARINRADSIVIVTPEYSSGYPGVLQERPGLFEAGVQAKTLWDHSRVLSRRRNDVPHFTAAGNFHLGGVPIPATLPVFRVQERFDADDNPQAPDFQKRAKDFFDELLWFTEALANHRAHTTRIVSSAGI